MKKPIISWNNQLKLIISDVDETVADLYLKAAPEMINKLSSLLRENIVLFFITGQGLKSVEWRIVNLISPLFRNRILVGHCSGAEVWGYDEAGELIKKPFYSVYTLTANQKNQWKKIVDQLVEEFKLNIYPPMPVTNFIKKVGNDPLSIMVEDRGPQVTFEIINGYDLTPVQVSQLEVKIPQTHGSYDLRIPILERADQLFQEADLAITSRLGGTFAIDFAIKGVSKTTAVKNILENEEILASKSLHKKDLQNPNRIEIWGDKFSTIRGGTDRHMCEALSKQVRSIDFRDENPDEFLKGYNTVVWNGKRRLHEGLLEYLQSRRNQ